MSHAKQPSELSDWILGCRDALPLLGGYIPIAISFGLISVQAGFSVWETTFISIFIYAGASQFLFVAMLASGSPLWLVVLMTLLINARHVVYGPNLAPWLTKDRRWIFLMHGLTDQVFALAHSKFAQLEAKQRLGWFTGAMLLAWFSWVFGTVLGALAGEELSALWPPLAQILPFALPALFLVLLAPRFNERLWALTIVVSVLVAVLVKIWGYSNAAIPVAALCGALAFYALSKVAIPVEEARLDEESSREEKSGGARNG